MATYKVIQDVEAEDKLVGPLTLRQFIFAGIAAISGYLGFLSLVKGAAYMLVIFLPITGVFGFFAFPFGKDQPTEIWALAKLRFFLKPRKRIWDQSGAKELVTITVPKKIERVLTNGLNPDEVRSRLGALADTIDSRGWAVKNSNLSFAMASPADSSDRLVSASSMPQQVSDVDVHAADDILDESANPVAQNFQNMIDASAAAHRQQLIAQMQQPATTLPAPQQTPTNNWFMPKGGTQAPFVDTTLAAPPAATATSIPQAATPTAEEEALVKKFKEANSSMSAAYGHMKVVKTPEEILAEDAARRAAATAKPAVTPDSQAAIMNLAQNDDLDVATIARQAKKAADENDDEIVISLH